MQADQPLPAAPAPGGGPPDPYDFLYQKPAKKGMGNLLPSGNSTKQRLLIVVVGGLGVLIVFSIVIAVILGSSKSGGTGLTSLAQQQNEIIRVSTEVSQKTQTSSILAYSQNIEYSTTTDQKTVLTYLGKHGTKLKAKSLALTQNLKTDQTLANASQAGDYDDVAVSTLSALEQAYQKQITVVFKTATPTQKQVLLTLYAHTVALLKNPPTVQPDSNS